MIFQQKVDFSTSKEQKSSFRKKKLNLKMWVLWFFGWFFFPSNHLERHNIIPKNFNSLNICIIGNLKLMLQSTAVLVNIVISTANQNPISSNNDSLSCRYQLKLAEIHFDKHKQDFPKTL